MFVYKKFLVKYILYFLCCGVDVEIFLILSSICFEVVVLRFIFFFVVFLFDCVCCDGCICVILICFCLVVGLLLFCVELWLEVVVMCLYIKLVILLNSLICVGVFGVLFVSIFFGFWYYGVYDMVYWWFFGCLWGCLVVFGRLIGEF